jgi:hypothetical protein
MAAELEINGLPCLVFGDGPQLVVFPGLGLANANPTGVQRWGEIRLLSPLARRFTVHRIGRRVGLEPSTTMADLANDYAGTLTTTPGPSVRRSPIPSTCSASPLAAL